MHAAQTFDPLLEPLCGAVGHRLDVAAGAEAASGAGDDNRSYGRISAQPLKRFPQAEQHRGRECVQPIRTVEGQPRDAVFRRLHKIRHLVALLAAAAI